MDQSSLAQPSPPSLLTGYFMSLKADLKKKEEEDAMRAERQRRLAEHAAERRAEVTQVRMVVYV